MQVAIQMQKEKNRVWVSFSKDGSIISNVWFAKSGGIYTVNANFCTTKISVMEDDMAYMKKVFDELQDEEDAKKVAERLLQIISGTASFICDDILAEVGQGVKS